MSRLLRGVVAALLLGVGLPCSRAKAENPYPPEIGPADINDASSISSDPQGPIVSQAAAYTPAISKVGFSLVYPTLSPKEPILLPEDLAARDEAKEPSNESPQSTFLRLPPRVTITNVYKVHVVSDCVMGRCYFRPVNVYIQPTNWFVDPDKASLQSLTAALKVHALHLLRMREKAARLHRNLLVRKPSSWLSRMRARLSAELGAVCFMQPAASQQPRGREPVRLLRANKQAKLNSLFDSSQKDQVFASPGDSIPLDPQIVDIKDAVANEEEYRRALEQAPQNVFGLCRRPRSNMLRRLADKGFVLCTVVLRKDQHFVDRCRDLAVDDIHTMQAVDKLHRRLNDPSLPMLGYVPMSLPMESTETLTAVLNDLERTVPPVTLEEASADPCVAHISRELQAIEELHAMELWQTAEMNKAITSEMVLRSMVKFAHFTVREIAPETSPEYRLSLLKLANKWSRTTELVRKFNEAVAACPTPTVRPVYFPQYESKMLPLPKESLSDIPFQLSKILSLQIPPIHRLLIGGAYLLSLTLNRRGLVEGIGRQEIPGLVLKTSDLLIAFASSHLQPAAQNHVRKYVQQVAQTAARILEIDLDPEIQWGLVRTLMVVPFWLFAFGRYCGPADKHAAFDLGYGLCPFHLLNFFVKDATATSLKQPGLQNWARRSISKLVKRVEVGTLPDKAKEHANVFLEQHIKFLPQLHPDLFRTQAGKVFKASPFPSSPRTT